MAALAARRQRTGESMAHIVMSALASELEVEHSTLFQVSTSAALVKGVYQGAVTIGELKQHGDFGLGTFDGLDGEMLAVDGQFYQMQSSGRVTEPANNATVPFAVVTAFHPTNRLAIRDVPEISELLTQLDTARQSDNLFYAVRIDGQFEAIRIRIACKTAGGVSLVEAAAHQAEFELATISGTLVGFWSPTYARTFNVPGWHLHFIDETRTKGGHVLDCRAAELSAQLQPLDDVRIAIPETAEFLQADLSRDPSKDLDIAERGKKRDS
jgi:acetolactate decarboxylase